MARLRSIPCKDAFAIFADPPRSICALRFPSPGRLRDFFDVSSLLIAAPPSDLLPQIHSQLFLCWQLQPLHFIWSINSPAGIMFCWCIVVWVGAFCLPAPRNSTNFTFAALELLEFPHEHQNFFLVFPKLGYSALWGFSAHGTPRWSPELLHSGFFVVVVSSAESCELFLYLFTWDKSQTPQYISCFHREGAGTPIQQNYNNLICLICWVSVCPKGKLFQQNQKRCKTERIFYKKLPYHRFLHHGL